jgi:hypothetical protein
VPRDPVLAALDHAEGPRRAWLAAVDSYARYGRPALAEVEPLGSGGSRCLGRDQACCARVRQKTRIRISGWTTLDPDHPEEVGKSRGTLWEITRS